MIMMTSRDRTTSVALDDPAPISRRSHALANGLAVGFDAGLDPRLVQLDDAREDETAYRAKGGYQAARSGQTLIQAVEEANLRGRGGAAFPTAVKLATLARSEGPKFVIANGDEGEPASIKDRWLMRARPHQVLDGVLLAADAIGADKAYLYVSDDDSAASLQAAITEAGTTVVPLEICKVERSYVGGEETSAVRFINGGPAKPTDKPPRPFEKGVKGKPTLVLNVETLANLPFIARHGAKVFRSVGSDAAAPGTLLLTITGAVRYPGLYEVSTGSKLGDVIERVAGFRGPPRAFLMGGFFGGLLGPRALDLPLSYDALRAQGSGLGCGAIVVLGVDDCAVAAAAEVMDYFARENANQCGACIRGTAAMSKVLNDLAQRRATVEELGRLKAWSTSLVGRGGCSVLDGAAALAGSVFREFTKEVESHVAEACPRCAAVRSAHPATRFSV